MAAAIASRCSFVVETVLSTAKYRRHVERARELGFTVGMVFITLPDAGFNVRRVAQRVSAGGHDVAEDHIRARFERAHDQLVSFLPLLDRLLVLDNAPLAGLVLVAIKTSTGLQLLQPGRLPEIDRRLLPLLS